jgi:hypothetical protein
MVFLELGVQDEAQHSALIEGPMVEGTEPGREGEDRAFAQLSGLIQESDETRLIDNQRLSIRQGHVGQRRCQAASDPGERNLGGRMEANRSQEGQSKGKAMRRHGTVVEVGANYFNLALLSHRRNRTDKRH